MGHVPTSAPAPAFAGGDASGPFRALLDRAYAPITLAEMDGVALQDRTDTKYVLTSGQLYAALDALAERYRVLEIGGTRVHPYQSVYFDTPDLALYLHHHAGRCNRYKVRSRQYVGTGLSFFEVKHKVKGTRTKKKRFHTDGLLTSVSAAAHDFVADCVPAEARGLAPSVTNGFSRVTLVSRASAERLTLDLDVRFARVGTGAAVALPGIAIAEVKQDGLDRASDFIRFMRAGGVRPMSFSKYCIGVSLLYGEVKHNRFKPKLCALDKLTRPQATHDA